MRGTATAAELRDVQQVLHGQLGQVRAPRPAGEQVLQQADASVTARASRVPSRAFFAALVTAQAAWLGAIAFAIVRLVG